MSNATQTFALKAPWIMAKLRDDFDLTEEQAAGIVGNLGHESAGFTAFQEAHPSAGRGGLGWGQWTGPRRVAFEAYCVRNKLDTHSDKANYAWLFLELKRSEKRAISKLKTADTIEEAVIVFEKAYERAGVKAYASRTTWAERALVAYRAAADGGLIPPHKPTSPDAPPAPPKQTGVIEVTLDTSKLPPAGKVVGWLAAAGAVAAAFGAPELAALLGKVTPETIDALYKVLVLGGGVISVVAGHLPNTKPEA